MGVLENQVLPGGLNPPPTGKKKRQPLDDFFTSHAKHHEHQRLNALPKGQTLVGRHWLFWPRKVNLPKISTHNTWDELSTYYPKALVYYILLSQRVCETGRLWRFSCSSKKVFVLFSEIHFATLKSSIGYHDHDHSAIFEKPPWTFFGSSRPQPKKPCKNICPIALEAQICRFPWLRCISPRFVLGRSRCFGQISCTTQGFADQSLCFFETYLGHGRFEHESLETLGGVQVTLHLRVWSPSNAKFPLGNKALIRPYSQGQWWWLILSICNNLGKDTLPEPRGSWYETNPLTMLLL